MDNIYSDDIIFMIYYILLSHHGNPRMVTWIEPVDNIHSDDRNDMEWYLLIMPSDPESHFDGTFGGYFFVRYYQPWWNLMGFWWDFVHNVGTIIWDHGRLPALGEITNHDAINYQPWSKYLWYYGRLRGIWSDWYIRILASVVVWIDIIASLRHEMVEPSNKGMRFWWGY